MPRSGWRHRWPAGSRPRPGSRPTGRWTRPARSMAEREYDIVLFGATGFTGGLTAKYLAANAGPETRWALAGRNQQKLEGVVQRLGAEHSDVALLQADIGDRESVRRLA